MKVTRELCNTTTKFVEISEILMNQSVLMVKGNSFRLCEIEFYYKNASHNDQYVHSIQDQQTFEGFYFHKYKNGSYKSGTYKGLDITFGNIETGTYFGILIRSMLDLNTGTFIEGPCRCVNRILELFKEPDVKNMMLHNKFVGQLNLYDESQELYLQETNKFDKQEIYIGPRVGLSDKYLEYLNKDYRHAIFINKIKKQKIYKINHLNPDF